MKRYVRAWRFRIYVPVMSMRFDQKQYKFKLRWNTILQRRQYLRYRRRNHEVEGLSRAPRSLNVFQSYKHNWHPRVKKWLCNTPYYREYMVSHEGIVKLHYRKRRFNPKKNKHRSVWHGHLRYEFQNPVRRRPRIGRETVSFGKSGAVPSLLRYSNRKRPSTLQEDFSEVFHKAFLCVWDHTVVSHQAAYAPLAFVSNEMSIKSMQLLDLQKN